LSRFARVRHPLLSLVSLALVGAGCAGDRTPEGSPPSAVPGVAEAVTAERADSAVGIAPTPLPPDDGSRPTFRRPEHVRALYLNAWAAGSRKRMDTLIAIARRTEINAFVIDIKDASGFMSHRTDVALAGEIGANGQPRIRDLRGLLRRLQAEEIYPIARIVIVRDPVLAAGRPGLTVQSDSGDPWQDDKGIVWMNIAQRGVWEYNVELAEEVARMGFPEIQWDYVRFPDAPRAVMASARFPGLEGAKADAVRAFLDYAGDRFDSLDLDVTHTADVFGITTSTPDVGIGQVWERFIDQVDVALPMVYPSHYYRGSFGYQRPNAYPYEVVRRALDRALERSKAVAGAGRVRPYLQDFSLGPPAYGAPEVRAQIQATYDAGIEEWVLWNAGSRYTEAALRPDDGWKEEPRIRLADRVVPMSRRFDLLAGKLTDEAMPAESAARAPRTAEPSTAPSAAAGEPTRVDARRSPDATQPRVWKPDALRRRNDSLSRARDTLQRRER
jgi:hypothetical protein